MPAWVRSALTTFLVTFLGLIPVVAVGNLDFTWAGQAALSAGLAALRTLVVAINPADPSYGLGAVPTPGPGPVVVAEPPANEIGDE